MDSAGLNERASELANRVRLAEAEGGSSGAASADLGALVMESISGLSSGDANAVLRLAESQVPGWSAGRALTGADGRVTVVAHSELRDAGFLSAELALVSAGLSDGERRAIGDRLAACGVVGQGSGEAGVEAMARAKRSLGLADGAEVSTDRVLEALSVVMEAMRSVDTLAWRTWRSMSQQSSIRKRGDLHVLLGRYVSGSGSESFESVSEDVSRLRQLLASLVASLGQAGDVAYRRVNTLNPMHIESLAGTEKGLAQSPEAACWRKYREMASQLDEATVQSETVKSLAAFAEGLMGSGEG
ncbi:MAG: hypothetical protein AAF297_01085 [Planctomycetota bacterium]